MRSGIDPESVRAESCATLEASGGGGRVRVAAAPEGCAARGVKFAYRDGQVALVARSSVKVW
eukprot:365969-Chlamydomonas_euryale.AAC.14